MRKILTITILVLSFNAIGQTPTNCQDTTFVNVSYKKLCSPSFIDDFEGKRISFKTLFLGEFTSTYYYVTSYGINVNDKVFINHKDTSDISNTSEKPNSGLTLPQMPCFALSIEKNKSDIIFDLNKGDIVEICGFAEKFKKEFVGTNGNVALVNRTLEIHIIGIKKINK